MSYHHLTIHERCQIYTLKSKNTSIREIARFLKISPSTISREIQRNSGARGYRFKQAQQKASSRRKAASSTPRRWYPALERQVEWMIGSQQWSPEQISGRLKLKGTLISHERIYQHVRMDRKRGGSLYKHLRHQGKPYYFSRKAGKGLIPNRVDISERPHIVDEKTRLGDWEADTIIGAAHKGAILSLVERASKFTMLKGLAHKTASLVADKIVSSFKCLQNHTAKTITFDNGLEFSKHGVVTEKVGVDCFFAKPYASWQRGLNEHTNGLVRQYLPKRTKLHKVQASKIKFIEDKLNNRPRKILGYRTPREVFEQMSQNASVALQC